MNLDISSLTMTEIIRLQNLLSQELSRRFETSAALAFTDIAGSAAYFARYGDELGRQLQQLHFDLIAKCMPAHGGRVVDTAGDGAFACFPSAHAVATAMIELQHLVSKENAHRERDHQLILRIGMHWGRVLTDGEQVTGDAVNLCSRIVNTADPGQIRLSRDLFQELGIGHRLQCRTLGNVELKGIGRGVELLLLDWRDRTAFPELVQIRETGEQFALPLQDIVSFGRLEIIEGMSANDIVLALPDAVAMRQISRWHFELRRRIDGYVLRAVSGQPTAVDGQMVERGQEVAIKPGSIVKVSGVMTLQFLSPAVAGAPTGDETALFSQRA